MKRLVLLLGAATLLVGAVYTTGVGPGPLHQNQSGGWYTLFELSIDSNGVTSATDLPSTLGTPDIIWFGWDPTTNNGSAGGTFTAAGAPGSVDSPFCPDADFSDISDSGDPSSTSCLAAKSFDGTNDYYEITGSSWDGDEENEDLSACVVHRPNEVAAAANAILGNTDDGDGDGWYLAYHGTLGTRIMVESDSPATVTDDEASLYQGTWAISCGTIDEDGNIISYMNSKASGASGHPAGNVTSSDALRIGASGTSRYEGDIVAAYVWDDTVLTSTQVDTFVTYWMGLAPGPGGTFTTYASSHISDGNTCCWTDATTPKLECFADNWPMIGCGVPPGLTGAGSTGGMISVTSETNRLKNSRDVSASWAEAGTVIGATSTANSPFRNNTHLPVTLLEDNDGGAAEYLSQGIDMTSLDTGDDVVGVLYVRSGSGSSGFDWRFREETGGACAAGNYDLDAVATTTTWSTHIFSHTVQDGDCESLIIYAGPVSGAHPADFANVAQTGTAYALFQVFFDRDHMPPIYIETGTSAATGGGTYLLWSNTAGDLLASAADFEKISVDYTLACTTHQYSAGHTYMYYHVDNYIRITTAGALQWIDFGSTNALVVAAPSFTTGTAATLRINADWGSDLYYMYQDDTEKDSSSNADAPNAGANDLSIGAYSTGAGELTGAFLKNFKITRAR